MMHFAWTPSENARSARAELETIASALPADAIAQLVVMGRRLTSVLEGHGDGNVDEQLAASKASGEPWTWTMAGRAEQVAVTLHQNIGGAPEELCKILGAWQRYGSPPETVRIVLTANEGSEIRGLAIADRP